MENKDNTTATTETTDVKPPVITNEIIKANFNVALTQHSIAIQQLQNRVDNQIYDEDHLQEIADLINDIKKIDKVVDKKHAEGKEPYLKITQMFDTVKRDYKQMTANLLQKPQGRHTELCKAIDERRKNAEREELRKKTIKEGMDNNILKFSQDIAAAITSKQLTDIEKLIGLEKTRREKYQEFLPEYVSRLNALDELLKKQKVTVKELEQLEKDKKEAEAKGDDEALINLSDKKEKLESKIEESKVTVQEHAIDSATKQTSGVQVAQEVFPAPVKPKRTTWKFELVDMKELEKKMPAWLVKSLNEEKAEEYLKTKKAEGIDENTEEFTFAGVRFYLEKKYS